jgi:hypothetical protein
MLSTPASQLKIDQFLRPSPQKKLDNDCFIIEPGYATSNKIANGPTDSVVPAATPKKHPKINDSDDDDAPLAPPHAADAVQNLTMQLGDGRGVVMPHHRETQAVAPSQPAPETHRRDNRTSTPFKAKNKHKRQAATPTTASV